jgi:SPP1 gp7 family putative phage head morphogenesis protein
MLLAEKAPKFSKAVFTRAMEHLHKRGFYATEMLNEAPFKAVLKETEKLFNRAVQEGIQDNDVPEEMLRKLQDDIFVFSGLKTHAQLKEAAKMLLTPDSKVKSFNTFRQEVEGLHQAYNVNYLEAEYVFATSSAQMAAHWSDYAKDGDRYNLQYRTAGDSRVRDSHAALAYVTLPVDDPFWNEYFAPNGWRCRCKVVQVRKGKYPESNSEEAIEAGIKATTRIDKDGNNSDAIFRFNPGKQQVIFPPKHPYRDSNKHVEKVLKQIDNTRESVIKQEISSLSDLNVVVADYAKLRPEMFAHGFKSLSYETRPNANGATDRRGNIFLKRDRVDNVIVGLNNIRQGQKTTYAQEDALATLWHEITHNANGKPDYLTDLERRRMELSNEFVARKTFGLFMNDLGGELQNKSFKTDRPSTGYNEWVKKYDALVKFTKADETKVLNDVRTHLFNESYKEQTTGLINAITNNSETFKASKVKKAVIFCTDPSMRLSDFENWLTRED